MVVHNPILWLAAQFVQVYSLITIIYLITMMLIQYGYAQRNNQLASMILSVGHAVVEPALRPIRQRMPATGNLDLSPIVLLIGMQFLLMTLGWIIGRLGLG